MKQPLQKALSTATMLCAGLRDAHSEACVNKPTVEQIALEILLLDLIEKAATIKNTLNQLAS